ncbi:hypothetical protein CONPUDRAFT_140472 [Coniophora puteana RWD-64-598 SS2]|uniref:1-alkyl-2-acetylglycerophosphocholine esterase n=1 Tax=Coniophora puteana (strain RWD-64-598) TaxID=741705 RepID=R7SDT0_CONPW|nr:uncharacterized protein CONPUDRAFT_140472 [Coniophora puteana RWD-64-598 SS2]EIW74323.1 hypothetical protein CONPUDRAFT_140472 [Coniophora puteana RWD-64-598 SS2]
MLPSTLQYTTMTDTPHPTASRNTSASTVPLLPATQDSEEAPPHLCTLSKRNVFGSLFSRTLPKYSGPYPVGVRDVELSIPTETFGDFRHKSMPNVSAGLSIDTVLFSLFYPAEIDPKTKNKNVVWFPRLAQTVDGFIRMANRMPNCVYRTVAYPAAAAAIWGTTFPGMQDAPLKNPPEEGQKWPIIIFSHGVGCSRLMYSSFCGEMASRGYIVAAVEHRDGTGPSCRVTNEHGDTKDLPWVQWSDLEWSETAQQPMNDTTLRHVQLEVRKAEVHHVLEAFRKISRGVRVRENTAGARQEGKRRAGAGAGTGADYDWSRWTAIDVEKPIVAGHSFGGTLAIAAGDDNRFNWTHVVAFDPAVQRLPGLDPWHGKIKAPLLVINSEEYCFGREFPILVQDIMPSAESADMFIIPGSTHPAFSDVFLILPDYINRLTGLSVNPLAVIDHTIDTTWKFVRGCLGTVVNDEKLRVVRGMKLTRGEVGPVGELVSWVPA